MTDMGDMPNYIISLYKDTKQMPFDISAPGMQLESFDHEQNIPTAQM